ncbi:MAG: sortase [Anaerolineae bacterium]
MSVKRLTASSYSRKPQAHDAGQLPVSVIFRRLEAKPLISPAHRLTARSLANFMLLLIEVGAVLAVAMLLAHSVRQWQSLLPGHTEPPVDLSQDAPEFSFEAGVLPGSHEAPLHSAVPNHLRGLVEPLPALSLPTSVPGRPSRIVIAKIGIDAPVVEGDGEEELKMGVGHRIGSANPGERNNMVLVGHNDIYGEVFRDLDRLDAGDVVVVYSGLEPFKYVVRQKRIVGATDMSVLGSTQVPTVTLISCYPYLVDTHRIVIIAELEP